jgi:Fe-S-cluster containining protein
MLFTRPVVRSYNWPYREQAAKWVRAGGHAIVWMSTRKARLVFPKPRPGDEGDLGWWAVLDLGRSEYLRPKSGPFSGLACLRVSHDCYGIVRERVVRDSVHEGPTRQIELDCLRCGACCKDNRVELEDEDTERFERAGRSDLTRPPFAKRDDGRLVLVLRKDKSCKHLGGDNRCAIYSIRPNACSTFPPASECCLSAREEELGIIDGLDAGGGGLDAGGG